MMRFVTATVGAMMAGAGLAVMAGAALAQEAGPKIDDIVWWDIQSYCSFSRANHTFDFNDPQSWRWVLFTNFPGDNGEDPMETLFMRIDGKLMQLAQTGVENIEGGITRSYASHGTEPYAVTVTMLDAREGYENTAYSGVITVSRGDASSEIAFAGDCGV